MALTGLADGMEVVGSDAGLPVSFRVQLGYGPRQDLQRGRQQLARRGRDR